jgi:hypothetical protein
VSTSLEVRISRRNDSLAFEFSREISFDFFVISNAEEHVFWELKPESMRPAPVLEAAMFGAQVPVELQRQIGEAIRDLASTHPANDDPVVTRIVYGEVPVGYREVVGVSPLRRGEKYCAFVWGDGFEATREYFVG